MERVLKLDKIAFGRDAADNIELDIINEIHEMFLCKQYDDEDDCMYDDMQYEFEHNGIEYLAMVNFGLNSINTLLIMSMEEFNDADDNHGGEFTDCTGIKYRIY